jgi:hypothetical protein
MATLYVACVLAGTVALMLCLPVSSRAQISQTPSGSISGSSGMGQQSGSRTGLGRTDPLANDDNFDPVMAERRLRALNAERQKQLVADTNKLLKLARELDEQVAATSSNSFTAEQLRKIGEIEKLAQSVRERMTTGVGEGPNMLPAPTLAYPVRQGP